VPFSCVLVSVLASTDKRAMRDPNPDVVLVESAAILILLGFLASPCDDSTVSATKSSQKLSQYLKPANCGLDEPASWAYACRLQLNALIDFSYVRLPRAERV
jgi:hypothetical protein